LFKEDACIAITGIGLRFPGGANNPSTFWANLANGVDAISEVDRDRWNPDTHYYSGSERKRSKSKTKWGGFVDDISGFDANFFGITPIEAETLDPQQRLLLEVCWNAFEDSRLNRQHLDSSKVGVFVGGFTLDYMLQQLSGTDLNTIQPHTATGSMMTMLSNRLSYAFNLTGPSMSIDTACSSSLVATHLACESLLRGESDIALAGGVNALLTPSYFVAESQAGMLSPTGRSRTFDSNADGYVRGEGAGVVVLKRLDDAIKAQDRIYAVIKATGTNQDGHSDSLTVPSGDSQMRLMREVYEKANIETSQVRFVESHGTGTPVGDPIEANAVGTVMSQSRSDEQPNCYISSVKTNIGHCEAAAGVAGLIKASLSIYNRKLPAHLHLNNINPKINLDELKLQIPVKLTELDEQPEDIFAGVNSFGFGGSNAHVVLQGYTEQECHSSYSHGTSLPKQLAETPNDQDKLTLFPVSAESSNSLKNYAGELANYVEKSTDNTALFDLFSTICQRREHHSMRAVVLAESKEDLQKQLNELAEGEPSPQTTPSNFEDLKPILDKPGQLVWVYTGMGPQWWAMGHELYKSELVFKDAFDKAVAAFDQFTLADGWCLKTELFKSDKESLIAQTRIAQTGNFVIQYALTEYWYSLGVRPDVIVGHSAGEACAAYASGALDFQDAVAVCYHRSIEQQKASGQGKMIAVDISIEEAQKLIESVSPGELSIAAVNSHDSLTIAGSNEAIDQLALQLEEVDTFSKVLRVDIPYHSHIMDALLPAVAAGLADINPKKETIPLYSTVTGEKIQGEKLDHNYWCDNVRKPVYFAKAIDAILHKGGRHFLEIGPHPVLGASIKKSIDGYCQQNSAIAQEFSTVQSLNRKRGEQLNILENLSKLYCNGFDVNWDAIYSKSNSRNKIVDFPQYQWDHREFWSEPPQTREFRVRQSKHPILSHRINTPIPTWSIDTFNGELAYIEDHQIQSSVVFPGAGYIEMFLAATRDIYNADTEFEITNIDLSKALYLQPDVKQDIQLSFDQNLGHFHVATKQYDGKFSEWVTNSSAKLLIKHSKADNAMDVKNIKSRCNQTFDKEAVYEHFRLLGLEYGTEFQGIESIQLGKKEVLAKLSLPESIAQNLHRYNLHPVVGDMCLQTLAGLLLGQTSEGGTVFLPVSIDKVKQHAPIKEASLVYSQIVEQTESHMVCDIYLLDKQGVVLVSLKGSRAKAIGAPNQFVERKSQDNYIIEWSLDESHTEVAQDVAADQTIKIVENTLKLSDVPGHWVVFGQYDDKFMQIQQHFAEKGDHVALVEKKQSSQSKYAIDNFKKESFTRAFDNIASDNSLPLKGIIYLWGTQVEHDGIDHGLTEEGLVTVSSGYTAMMQAAIEIDWDDIQHSIWCVTDKAQMVTANDQKINPIQAVMWGISRVAGQVEHDDLWGGIVDLDYGSAKDIKCFCDHIAIGPREDQWAIREGQVYLPSLKAMESSDTDTKPVFASDVSYFISGGLGSLGVITANWLIDCGAKHLILASRSPLPNRAEWLDMPIDHKAYNKVQTILKLESKGASVTHAPVDVANMDQLTSFIDQHQSDSKPPIKAVYHTAGVAIPELITNLDSENFSKVLPAKIQGTLNLHEAFSDTDLDAFVLYSSLASVVTSSGQASYSGANAFLDSFAHWRQLQGKSGLSINWGPWGEVGMAAELNLVDFFASRGFFAMSNLQGVNELNKLLVKSQPQIVVVGADWVTACEAGYPDGQPPAYLEHVLNEAIASQADEDDEANEDSINFILSYIETETSEERLAFIQDKLVKIVSQVLRLSIDDVSVSQSFTALGLDSMLAIELRARVERMLDVKVAVVDLLKNVPITELSAQFFEELELKADELEQEVLEDVADIKEAS